MGNESKYRAPAYYDGIGPLPMTQWTEEGYLMDWSDYRFTHRNFQDSIALSIAPLQWSGEMVFLNGIEGFENLWPDKFMQMRRRLQLPRNANFTHCLYGDVFGHFTQFRPRYSAQTTNGTIVDFTFVQVFAQKDKTFQTTQWNRLQSAKDSAAAVDAGLALLSKEPGPLDDFPKPSLALRSVMQQIPLLDRVTQFETFLNEKKQLITDIEAEVAAVGARFDEVLALPELLLTTNADIMEMCLKSKADVAEGAKQKAEGSAQIIVFEVDRTLTAPEICQRLYEDPDRTEEFFALNPTPSAEWKKGELLRALDV